MTGSDPFVWVFLLRLLGILQMCTQMCTAVTSTLYRFLTSNTF